MKRRNFLQKSAQTGALLTLGSLIPNTVLGMPFTKTDTELFFKLSLAEWSFHRAIKSGEMDHLDFAAKAQSFGCTGVEYVSNLFKTKAKDKTYLKQMNTRVADAGVENVLIMIGGEGNLATANAQDRLKAIERHYKWIDAAHFLGCKTIRVDLRGGTDKTEAAKASAASLATLANFAKSSNINVVVENHGGFSSDGVWLSNIMKQVGLSNCGTLPDFGNFCITKDKNKNCLESYDLYKGMEELLPFAKGVSAKSKNFAADGTETDIDFYKIMKLVKESGYTGFVGIEYEGTLLSEDEGVQKTKDLLLKVAKQL
ncbi:sugar phosphate isomerase/epimerase [Cellulophaga sp. 20_2_10]|uniref:sugar phosphate isomerase/epimerase family protein n=1 Tax=Cellulophaga sp. 20_2_10 TaxID=2942476 RepID=UPI00201A6434|nr:TIM barrel protein [Cellulophaga sp. 20_2_10]MCL5245351.1 sugar phosphate isomerase/epimerase [Cellulophaga sp. 20_2_10]